MSCSSRELIADQVSERHVISKEVEQNLNEDGMQPLDIPCSSPVMIMKKKNGKWRFCVDYGRIKKGDEEGRQSITLH